MHLSPTPAAAGVIHVYKRIERALHCQVRSAVLAYIPIRYGALAALGPLQLGRHWWRPDGRKELSDLKNAECR